jgi:type II secretory pathway component PulF
MSPTAIVITPGQLTRRAELYHQLGQLVAAGLPVLRALEQIERHPPSRSYRRPLQTLRQAVLEGSTFHEAAAQSGPWISAFELALIDAGERSGRLDVCFRALSDYYSDRASTARQMLADLAYPVFLFHFAIFILPFAQFFTAGDWKVYMLKTLGVLGPIYGLTLLGIYAAQGKHGAGWRSVLEQLLHPVPLLGSGRRELALARLCLALEAMLNAGVSIINGWQMAALVSGSPFLQRTVLAWQPQVFGGQTPAEAVTASRAFPEMFANQYHAGEISGKLEENLKHLQRYYQEEGQRKVRAFCQWVPRFIYLVVALFIAYRVVTFYTGYFNQINQIMAP